MNGQLDGWMTNLSFKKNKNKTCTHVCMRIIQNDNEQREKKKIKKENQTKQPKNTINSVANMQEQQQSDVTIAK